MKEKFWNTPRRRIVSRTLMNLSLLLVGALGTSEVLKFPWWLILVIGISAILAFTGGTVICPPEEKGED